MCAGGKLFISKTWSYFVLIGPTKILKIGQQIGQQIRFLRQKMIFALAREVMKMDSFRNFLLDQKVNYVIL